MPREGVKKGEDFSDIPSGMGPHETRLRAQGFSLLELVVIVAVLVLMAGIIAPTAQHLLVDAKAQKISDLAEALRGACMRYHLDTNAYAKEGVFAAPDAEGEYPDLITDRREYLLSYAAGTPSWNGPYTDHPLLPSDNPTGNPIFVSNQLNDGAAMQGFDLDGTGLERTGPGNMLVVQLDPRDRGTATRIAARVDALVDGADGSAQWMSKGRVNFVLMSCKLYVYLYQGP